MEKAIITKEQKLEILKGVREDIVSGKRHLCPSFQVWTPKVTGAYLPINNIIRDHFSEIMDIVDLEVLLWSLEDQKSRQQFLDDLEKLIKDAV